MGKSNGKEWYFIVWEERHLRRGATVYNTVTDEHPIKFLLQAREATRFKVNLLFWVKMDISSNQAAAWRKRLDGFD